MGDCLHEAANYTGTNFFLIHGTADDNVHYTNAAKLAFELVENDVQFRMHAYTGQSVSQSVRQSVSQSVSQTDRDREKH